MTQDLDPNLLPVNNFFAHWIKETDVTKYGTNKSLIQTTTPQDVYRYSDAMLKHLPKNALKMIQKDILFSKKTVIYLANSDRRSHEPMITSKIGKTNLRYKLIQNMCIEYH